MRLPACLILSLQLLVCGAAFCASVGSQTIAPKRNTEATVSGKVTIKGKPAPGILVGLRLNSNSEAESTFKATTDQEGNYRITDLPAGNCTVAPVAPAFVSQGLDEPNGRPLIISEGEHIEGLDFDLVRGGVITGKVTDEQGHPVVEERVNLLVVLDPKRGGSYRGHTVATDDRGIYRIFGIRPGQYKVLISMEGNYYSGRGRPQHRTTFYPDATDVNQATIIEVRESAEVTKIDFTVAALPEGHAASGRVLDETGQPVPNALISLSQITVMDPNSTTSYGMNSGVHSDKQGEFRIEDLAPGKYSISVSLPPESDMRPESVTFDLVDADVTGLVIKTSRGGSVAGTLVIEGGKAADLMANLTDTFMEVNLSHPETRDSSGRSVPIGRDGSFRVGGLDAGIVRLSVESPAGFTLARIERDGVTQPNSIPLRKGEHIDGIRVVLVRHTGSVRGVIKLENGVLPANGRFIVQVIKVDNRNERSSSAQVDLRGHFVVEGLGDGNYELMVFLYVPGSPKSFPSAKQIISVTDGAVTEVTLTVDLAAPLIR